MQALKSFCEQNLTCLGIKEKAKTRQAELTKKKRVIRDAIVAEIAKIEESPSERYKIHVQNGVAYLRLANSRTYNRITEEHIDFSFDKWESGTIEELINHIVNQIQKQRTIVNCNNIIISTSVPRSNFVTKDAPRRLQALAIQYTEVCADLRGINHSTATQVKSAVPNDTVKTQVLNFFQESGKDHVTVKLNDGTYRICKESKLKAKKPQTKKYIHDLLLKATETLDFSSNITRDEAIRAKPLLVELLKERIGEEEDRERYEQVVLKKVTRKRVRAPTKA